MKGRQPENRRENLRRWKLTPILSSLPILLHISLLLFFAGLLDFLWLINSTVAIVSASLVSATVFIYIVTHVLSLISVTCPFRTSVTSAILSSISSVSRELIADMLSLIFTGALYAILLIKWLHSKGSTRNRERYAFAARLAGPSRWRRAFKAFWSRKIKVSPRALEDGYITHHSDLIDARALARMIAEFPRAKDSPALLVQQLCQFSGLISHRRLFIANGAVALLGQELRSLCFSNSASLEPPKQETVSRCCRTLACLLTEVEGSDPYSATIYDGIPLHYDPELDNVFEDDRGVEFLTSSGLFVVDAATNDDDDITLFANTLRIQLAVSSNLCYWRDIRGSVEELFRRLIDGRVTAGLADEDILILVNTTIYIGRRQVYALANNDFWEENTWHTEHVTRTLDVLATLTLCRPNIGFAIRRQIFGESGLVPVQIS